MKEQREQEQRAQEDIQRDATWGRLMAQDGVDTDAAPVPIGRDQGRSPQREGRRRVIEATYLHRQKGRYTLKSHLELTHAHAELNGVNCRVRIKNGTPLKRSSWCNARR